MKKLSLINLLLLFIVNSAFAQQVIYCSEFSYSSCPVNLGCAQVCNSPCEKGEICATVCDEDNGCEGKVSVYTINDVASMTSVYQDENSELASELKKARKARRKLKRKIRNLKN